MAAAAILDFRNSQILLAEGFMRSRCNTVPNFVKICQSIAAISRLFNFSRWRPSAILDLCGPNLNHPGRILGGLYHCAIFRCNQCST